jgi:hypothetical protein
MLPDVRGAFESLHERQRRSLADRVAERYGLSDATVLVTLQTSASAARQLAAIDAKVSEIMKTWVLE